jgi:hypothetical protein
MKARHSIFNPRISNKKWNKNRRRNWNKIAHRGHRARVKSGKRW